MGLQSSLLSMPVPVFMETVLASDLMVAKACEGMGRRVTMKRWCRPVENGPVGLGQPP